MQHKNRIIFISIALLLAFTGVVVLNIKKRLETSGKIAVALYVLPENATVTVNGKTEHEGTIYLTAGDYKVESTQPGYTNFSRTYRIDPSIKNPLIDIILPANSTAAQNYYSQNSALVHKREGIGSQESHQQSSLIISKNPLTQQLPYQSLLYTIGYQSDTSDPTGQSIIVVINAPIGYRNAAVDKIRDLGYNPSDYTIRFENYTNPFTNE